jgi:hypothetical protein
MCRDFICRDSTYGLNKYVEGALERLKSIDESVTVLPTASNEEYDRLLERNIVFINLIDAAAVNALLECIVRCTPVLVNSLPAVIEVLGEGYPLYYDGNVKIEDVIADENVEAAHVYLKNLDKVQISGDHFLATFTSSVIYQKL